MNKSLKTVTFVFVLCFSLAASAKYSLYPAQPTNPDISVQGYFGRDAQAILVDYAQKALSKYQDFNILKYNNPKKVSFTTPIKSRLRDEINKIIEDLLGVPLKEARIDIELSGVRYEIGNYDLKLTQLSNSGESYKFNVNVEFSNIEATTHQASIMFGVSQGYKSFLDGLELQVLNPRIYSKNLKSIELSFNVEMYLEDELFQFKITEESIKSLEGIDNKDIGNLIEIELGEAKATDLGIEINGMLFALNQEGLNRAIRKRRFNISKMLMKPIANNISKVVNVLSENLKKLKIKQSNYFNLMNKKQGIKIESFGLVTKEQLQLNLNYLSEAKVTEKYSRVNENDNRFESSQKEITESISSFRNHLNFSISENAINEFVENNFSTISKAINLPNILKFGPEKIKFLMNNDREGTTIIDLLVQPKGFIKFGLKLLTGYKQLRVPIQVIPKLAIKKDDVDIPFFELTFEPITNDEALLSDVMGIENSLSRVKRNKNFTLKIFKKIIKKKVNEIKPIKIPLAALQGQTLGMFDYGSDSNGRYNIGLNLSGDTMRGKNAWKLIDQIVELVRDSVRNNKNVSK